VTVAVSDPGSIIRTPRLWLRRVLAEDGEWLSALDSDPAVMRFITGGVPTPREQFTQVILPRMLQSYPAGPQFGFLAALIPNMAEPVGWFHLRPEKQEPFEMELGYRLRRDVWGQGLATEGSLELLRQSFGEWKLPRVVAHTLAENQASRRVMEKCGMRLVREFTAPESLHPGWSEVERRAVRYQVDASSFRG
jgi:RimJ/RimL family protein N-acetyltransferase